MRRLGAGDGGNGNSGQGGGNGGQGDQGLFHRLSPLMCVAVSAAMGLYNHAAPEPDLNGMVHLRFMAMGKTSGVRIEKRLALKGLKAQRAGEKLLYPWGSHVDFFRQQTGSRA
jgi:hypothetical protein